MTWSRRAGAGGHQQEGGDVNDKQPETTLDALLALRAAGRHFVETLAASLRIDRLVRWLAAKLTK